MLATLRLAVVMRWQTTETVRSQHEAEVRRQEFDFDVERRQMIDRDLGRMMNGDWKPSIREMCVQGRTGDIQELLATEGITLDELKRYFPAVFGARPPS
ncbi:MAG TPA: hypothetical protein VGB18_03305 [Candidatus Thermoplasmatota archaeon]